MKMKHLFGATAIAVVMSAGATLAADTTVIGVSIPAASPIGIVA